MEMLRRFAARAINAVTSKAEVSDTGRRSVRDAWLAGAVCVSIGFLIPLMAVGADPSASETENSELRAANPAEDAEPIWQTYYSFDGTFQVEAPGLPDLDGTGGEVMVDFYRFQDGETQWTVSVLDGGKAIPPGEVDSVMQDIVRGYAEGSNGEILFDERRPRAALPSRRFAIVFDSRHGLGEVTMVDGRAYAVMRIGPGTHVRQWDENDRFLNSFTIKRDAIAPYRKAFAEFVRLGDNARTLMMLRMFQLRRQGQLADSIAIARLFAHAYVFNLGPNHVDTAMIQGSLGQLLGMAYAFDEAEYHIRRAIRIYTDSLGEDSDEALRQRDNLSQVLRNRGELRAAREELAAVYAGYTRRHGADHSDTIKTLTELARMTHLLGDHRTALSLIEGEFDHLRQLVAASSEDPAADRKEEGSSDESWAKAELASRLDLAGVCAKHLSDYANARRWLEEALQLREEIYGRDGTITAVTVHNLGQLALLEGDAAAARDRFENALGVLIRDVGPTHLTTLEYRISLATSLEALGDAPAAEKQWLEVLAARRQILGDKHHAVAAALDGLGTLWLAQGDTAKAAQYLSAAYEIDSQIKPEEHPNLIEAISNYGHLFLQMGDFEAAKRAFLKTCEITETRLGAENHRLFIPLNGLGKIAFLSGDFKEAEKLFTRSKALLSRANDGNHHGIADIDMKLADVAFARGDVSQAAEYYDQARRRLRQFTAGQLSALSEDEQLRFLTTHDQSSLHIAVHFASRCGDREEIAQRSAEWMINGKAVRNEVLARRAALTRASSESGDERLAELIAVREQSARLFINSPLTSTQEQGSELERLKEQEQKLVRELAKSHARLITAPEWVSLDRVRESLPKDAVLVDIFRLDGRLSARERAEYAVAAANSADRKGSNSEVPAEHDQQRPTTESATGIQDEDESRYYAWIVPPAGMGTVQMVDLGPAKLLEAALNNVRSAMQDAAHDIESIESDERTAEDAVRKELAACSKLVLHPLDESLRGARRLIVCPDGPLWLLAWDALITPEDRYAVEQFRIDFVHSGRELIPEEPSTTSVTGAVVLADPDYDYLPNDVADQREQGGTHPQKRDARIPYVQRLPGTQREANMVAERLATISAEPPRLLLGAEASEATLKSVQRPALLVLATHGFFLDESADQPAPSQPAAEKSQTTPDADRRLENPLLQCGLLLAGCNRRTDLPADQDDGILTGAEVLGLDLEGTRLVVLSACETGLGDPLIGEGVAGLRQAFLLAGAETVVSTLWPVEDFETARFMQTYFDHLTSGLARGDALRQAKLDRIASRRDRYGAAHPYFWSAFMTSGHSDRSLDLAHRQ